MDEKLIARINELARKAKNEGLTEAEKTERAKLRQEYIAAIRINLRSQLDSIDIQEKDGSIVNLGEKYGRKKLIRKEVFARRAKWSDEQVEANSRIIAEKIIQTSQFQEASQIYAYIDYNHEVSTRGIIEAAWKTGKQVAVPKVVGKDLIFYELRSFDQLEEGYYGILEPASGEIVDWEKPLMIMPGVAFDSARHRVGYGGGFYDRFLEVHKIPTIAIAFDFQIMNEVPVEPTDILPDVVITEQKIYK